MKPFAILLMSAADRRICLQTVGELCGKWRTANAAALDRATAASNARLDAQNAADRMSPVAASAADALLETTLQECFSYLAELHTIHLDQTRALAALEEAVDEEARAAPADDDDAPSSSSASSSASSSSSASASSDITPGERLIGYVRRLVARNARELVLKRSIVDELSACDAARREDMLTLLDAWLMEPFAGGESAQEALFWSQVLSVS